MWCSISREMGTCAPVPSSTMSVSMWVMKPFSGGVGARAYHWRTS